MSVRTLSHVEYSSRRCFRADMWVVGFVGCGLLTLLLMENVAIETYLLLSLDSFIGREVYNLWA